MNTRKSSRWFFWILGLGCLVGSAAGARWFLMHGATAAAPAAIPVAVAAASVGEGPANGFGYVDAPDGIQALMPLQAGRVVEVLVKEGDTVASGAVLLKLDDKAARALKSVAKADLDAAQAQLADANLLQAQKEAKVEQQEAAIQAMERERESTMLKYQYERFMQTTRGGQENDDVKAIKKKGEQLAELVKVEQAKLKELKLSDPNITVQRAEAEVAARQARLDQAQQVLDEYELKAPPVEGTILRLQVSKGDVIGPQAKQPPIIFCPTGARVVRAEIAQEFASRIKVGDPVEVNDDVKGSGKWTGKVSRISDWYTHRRSFILEPLEFNDVRTLECLVTLDNDKGLRIGQRVRVKIPAE